MNSTTSDLSPEQPQPGSESIATVCAYVENNPLAAVVQALAVGFLIGLIIRWLEGPREKGIKEVDVDHRPSLEEAKFHLGSLLLPFLWPAWQKTREKYGESAETIQEAVGKLKKSDLAKIGQKKAKLAAKWADVEAAKLSKSGRKTKEQILEWLEQEAEELLKAGKKTAKQVEEWVDDDVKPSTCKGWKMLKKFWS